MGTIATEHPGRGAPEVPLNRAGEPVVLTRRVGHVGIVTLNRPEVRNAVDQRLERALADVWARHEADDDIWVHVVTGAGDRAFSAGADLKEVARAGVGSGRSVSSEENTLGFGGVTLGLRKPVVAAVNGFALGGGCELVLGCDLVVAEEQARIGLPEVLRGLTAGAGGTVRLPRRIPPNVAMEMILTGEPVTAQRAYELGLVNRVVPTGHGLDEAIELAQQVCRGGPRTVQYSKAVARASVALGELDANAAGPGLHRAWSQSGEVAEGATAFIERRPPHWESAGHPGLPPVREVDR